MKDALKLFQKYFILFTAIIIFNKSLVLANINSNSINIATASNFTDTLKEITSLYQELYPNSKIKIISGSTVNLYTQIINGAPFDIFFAADKKHINLLIEKNLALKESDFIYASGRLALWSPGQTRAEEILTSLNFNHLAIAKPEFAPYGIAAKEVLEELELFNKLKADNKLIYGQNVLAAMNYIANKHVDLGFISLSQIISWQIKHNVNLENEIWIIPQKFYQPIEQKTVILQKANKELAQDFLNFVKNNKKVRQIIIKYGYK